MPHSWGRFPAETEKMNMSMSVFKKTKKMLLSKTAQAWEKNNKLWCGSESRHIIAWKVDRLLTASIINVSKENFKTIQQNHNNCTWEPSRKLYLGREQLVSPWMRSFGAKNYGCTPGIRAIKKKNKTPLRALTCTWPRNHHLGAIQITTRAPLLQHLVLHMRSWQCRGGELAERTSQTSSVHIE